MSIMTIEKQMECIKEEQGIIDGIRNRCPIKPYNLGYIRALEDKIKQRKDWIDAQKGAEGDV